MLEGPSAIYLKCTAMPMKVYGNSLTQSKSTTVIKKYTQYTVKQNISNFIYYSVYILDYCTFLFYCYNNNLVTPCMYSSLNYNLFFKI